MNVLEKAYCRSYQKVFKVASNILINWDPPKVVEGENSVYKIPQILKDNGIKRVLFVTDNGLRGLGIPDGLLDALKKDGIEATVFSEIQPNPSIENVENAKQTYIDNNCQGIIAMGGGSPMDCAKGAGARVANPTQTIPQMRGQLKIKKPLPFFIAIPTTAGTGSETTVAAVITDMSTHEKYAVNDPKLRPKYAVLDPMLTLGLPPHITSTTGMDALTHAVEAYIGHSNTEDTIEYAEKATKLIFDNIETVYQDGKNVEARKNMLLASYYAGAAFTRAYVGYVHAIAHQLGGIYGIPHGLANAVILPHILDAFGESAYEPLAKLADCAGTSSSGQSVAEKACGFIEAVKELNRKMNIPEKFDKIEEKDIPTIVERALREANPLYPVPKLMGKEELTEIVKGLMM